LVGLRHKVERGDLIKEKLKRSTRVTERKGWREGGEKLSGGRKRKYISRGIRSGGGNGTGLKKKMGWPLDRGIQLEGGKKGGGGVGGGQ